MTERDKKIIDLYLNHNNHYLQRKFNLIYANTEATS